MAVFSFLAVIKTPPSEILISRVLGECHINNECLGVREIVLSMSPAGSAL